MACLMMLRFHFPLSLFQASRSTYSDYCSSNLSHLIGIEVCDYSGMQTHAGMLIGVCNSGKVCGHVTSFCGGGTVTLAAGWKEAGRWRYSCFSCKGKAVLCNTQGGTHLPAFVSVPAMCEVQPSQTPVPHCNKEISVNWHEFGSSLPVYLVSLFVLESYLPYNPSLASSIISADRWACVHLH